MAKKLWEGGQTGNEGKYDLAANWSPSGVPAGGDSVYMRGSQDITDGLDQSLIALDDFVVEKSYSGKLGTSAAALQVGITSSTGRVEYSGSGESYIDVGGSTIDVTIHTTGAAAVGKHGLYIQGTAIGTLSVEGGNVGISLQAPGDASTITTLRALGGHVTGGEGLTVTNVDVGGSAILELRAGCSDLDIRSGTVTTSAAAGISSSVTLWGGVLIHNGTGTIASAIIQGGELDVSQGGLVTTVSSLKLNEGSFIYDPESVTVTSIVEADHPVRWSSSKSS